MATDINLMRERMNEVGDSIKSALAKWERAYDQLDKMAEQNPSLKDNRGKLTELGRARMDDMIKDGKSNTEIAAFFNVSPSAVSYRRK